MAHRLHQRGLDLVRRHQIRRADLDLEAERRGRLGVIDDRFLRDDVVRQDDQVARLRAQLGRAPRHFRHAAFIVPDPHPVPDVKRFLALDGEAGERVAERVLQREAEHHRADRGRRDELPG